MNIPVVAESIETEKNELINPQDLFAAIVEAGGTASPIFLSEKFGQPVHLIGLALKVAVKRGYVEKTGPSSFSAIAEDRFEEPTDEEISELFPGVSARIELIGPRKASEALKGMAPNRKTSGSNRVAEYARAMKENRWYLSQPVIYDKSGRLIDGQHRYLAVIASGKQVFFWVIRGADEEVMAVLDSGKPRSVHDSIQIAGVDADKMRVSVLKAMFFKVGIAARREYDDYGKLLELYTRHKQAIDFASKTRSEAGVQKCTTALIRAVVARAYYYCVDLTRKDYSPDDLKRLERFCWVPDNGFTETNEDRIPAALRDYWLFNRGRSSDDSRRTLYAKAVRAIKRYLDGEGLGSNVSLPLAKIQYFPVKDFD